MKSINLILGCHSHQPIGNFESVLRDSYEKSYKPFVDVLERYPAVKCALHYTGPLWDWFEAHEPGYIERLKALVGKGQVEITGGAYYEPLLCAIPERDAIAQVHRMQDYCERRFGKKPRGMWLTERVWEPQMARAMARAGVEYAFLDDSHFLCSGLRPDQMFGYYMTEDEGQSVKVFPILEKLRYTVPFHPVHETIEYLREHASEDGLRCAVLHDDGEKFGVWPGTYNSVYEQGWLDEFFQAITDNGEWLHCITYEEYIAKARALGRVYITCASYQEMMGWTLPTDMQREFNDVVHQLKDDPVNGPRLGQFIKGGFWRSFLAKYEESNNIQKRMLRVSDRLERLRAKHEAAPDWIAAQKLLHEGQCNCAYWHGVFGGLYLNHLRTAIYQKLIEASRVLDRLAPPAAEAECIDFDGDGNQEAVLENNTLSLFLHPVDGGTLFELDYKPKPFNFLNTLTRREEPYHDSLRMGKVHVGDGASGGESIHDLVQAKEAGLENLLVYDAYRRVSLRDHFWGEEPTAEALWAGTHEEWGDFATGEYALTPENGAVRLCRDGLVGNGEKRRVRVTKRVSLAPGASSFEIGYDVCLLEGGPLDVVFGVELAANLLTGDAHDRYYRSDDRDLGCTKLGVMGEQEALHHIALRDDWQQFEIGYHFEAPARVLHFAIETVSSSEAGQERVYQGSVLTPCWRLSLSTEKPAALRMKVEIASAGCAQ